MEMAVIKKAILVTKNMGGRYVAFRIAHELKARFGLLKRKFPTNPARRQFTTLNEWRNLPVSFFFKERFRMNGDVPRELAVQFEELQEGKFIFFSSTTYLLGKNDDWLTNPESGYQYSADAHWTEINDYSKEAGDIKYVWEKSRFTFLYTIIRYDAYTGEDHSGWVFDEILSWIKANPINCGPHFKCSQEISLRVLNWTFALNFYKNSNALTEQVFQEIMHAIYWQLHHVYHNINFSRIAVRNNHAITETLTLYLGGLLFPFFPEAPLWKRNGKKWFEEEVAYQVYDDGTFLQFSMNYHRVVIQLLTWAIRLAELNQERFQTVVYDRARNSLDFLNACLDVDTGWLPNYGSNDGALFFPLSSCHFRDYRPQLDALGLTLGVEVKSHKAFEDARWYGIKNTPRVGMPPIVVGSRSFEKGGYYLFRSIHGFSFIRCGSHKDRPFQADNLHLDIWHQGKNLLHDGGSYKYNTNEKDLKYFMGSASHNSVMLGDHDQMQKGSRFIWYHWTQRENASVVETDEYFRFEGTIKAFGHIGRDIYHRRTLKVYKHKAYWEVEDSIINKPPKLELRQMWHTSYPEVLSWKAKIASGESVFPKVQSGFVSHLYGKKETCNELIFSTLQDYICTQIWILR